MENWIEHSHFFIALLVILDPFAAVPVFLSLTHDYTPAERARVTVIASVTVGAVLMVAALSGESVLHLMGTSLASFRVGGGIVLLLMALSMLRAQPDPVRGTQSEAAIAETKATVAVVPLAVPLLAGPGAISTVIIEMNRTAGAPHIAMVIGVILALSVTLWVVLRLAAPIGTALGAIGLKILNRLFGLLLTAIAVETMANGLKELFPTLVG